jgi:hypothetical protein
MSPAYYLVGVLAGECSDGEWCAAQSGGGMEEDSREEIGFYGIGGTDYYVVVQSMDGDYLDYWIEIREGMVVGEIGTCDYPFELGAPDTVSASTVDQPNLFTQICGSSCCDGAEYVFAFSPPENATYEFTLTNDGIDGAMTLAMLDMCMDSYPCITDTAGGAGNGGQISISQMLNMDQTVYLVVQGAWGDGGFSLEVAMIPDAGNGDCGSPFVVDIEGGSWVHADTTQGKDAMVEDYSTCSVDSPVMETFPGPEAVYRLYAPMQATYLIEASFDGGGDGVLALMSECDGTVNSCLDAVGSAEGISRLTLSADIDSTYYLFVDRNPPGAYSLTVTPCDSMDCIASSADGCCPNICNAEQDLDCCNLASCALTMNDYCCPVACNAVDDLDCCDSSACNDLGSDDCCPEGCNMADDPDCP